jgi:hypothetical protein
MTRLAPISMFSAGERNYIRRELDMFFSTLPTVAEGFPLKTASKWNGWMGFARTGLSHGAQAGCWGAVVFES